MYAVHLLFYDIILLFKSVQGGTGCLKITKFERTYFMDGPMVKCPSDALFRAVIFHKSSSRFYFAGSLIQLTTKIAKITSQKYKSLNKSKLTQSQFTKLKKSVSEGQFFIL